MTERGTDSAETEMKRKARKVTLEKLKEEDKRSLAIHSRWHKNTSQRIKNERDFLDNIENL